MGNRWHGLQKAAILSRTLGSMGRRSTRIRSQVGYIEAEVAVVDRCWHVSKTKLHESMNEPTVDFLPSFLPSFRGHPHPLTISVHVFAAYSCASSLKPSWSLPTTASLAMYSASRWSFITCRTNNEN